jgi:beta-1,2-mannobiose phosphorylase / 1,2-beta-oligomannan phosphorylase
VIEPQRTSGGALEVAYRRLGIVLAPSGSELDAEGVLNPAAVRDRKGNLLLYPRMVAAGNVSRIGLVRVRETKAGRTFSPATVLFEPVASYERRDVPGGFGCEDARVTFIPRLDAYVMAYTAFGPHGPRVALAISNDGYSWLRLGLVRFADEPLNHVPNKDAAFFPEPVLSPSGVLSFAMYHRPMLRESFNGQAPIALIESLPPERREVTCIAYVPVTDVFRDVSALRNVRESTTAVPIGERWGRLKNGAGTPPVKTALGWLSFFHGVDALAGVGGPTLYYRAGIVVHDLHRPDRLIYRSAEPLFAPELPEERVGIVNDVVFPSGIDVRSPGHYDVYYGAADARIGCARVVVSVN